MGRRRAFGEYPFWLVATIVGALTLGLIFVGVELKWGAYSYVLVVIPIGVAAAYLVSYARVMPPTPVPSPVPRPSSTAGGGDAPQEEEFDDPVEEADRIASGEVLPPPPPD